MAIEIIDSWETLTISDAKEKWGNCCELKIVSEPDTEDDEAIECVIYINEDNAIWIVNHLKEQFGI